MRTAFRRPTLQGLVYRTASVSGYTTPIALGETVRDGAASRRARQLTSVGDVVHQRVA